MMLQSRNKLLGLSALLTASFLLLGCSVFFKLPAAAAWVLVWAGFESVAAFLGVTWGLERSNKIFLSLFFGGMLLRLVSIGVAAAVLVQLQISPAVPLLTLVGGYFLLSLVQLPFLNHELR